MQKLLVIFVLILHTQLYAQETWTLAPATKINSPENEIACGMFEDQIIFAADGGHDYLNDYEWNKGKVFRLYTAERGATYGEIHSKKRLFPIASEIGEGTGFYDSADSTLYFSSTNNFGEQKPPGMKIFSCNWDGESWTEPLLLPFCNTRWEYMHPWYDPIENVIVFTSNIPGGVGGMDIWYSFKTKSGWTEPFNPGPQVNTPRNEAFPSIHKGDIYFASNGRGGWGGYDLFKTLKKQQWSAAIQLEPPFNSTEDDVMLFYIDDESGFLSSNRKGGVGGDDIFHFKRVPKKTETGNFTGVLYLKDQSAKNTEVRIYNELLEVALETNTGNSGIFQMNNMPLGKRFVLKILSDDISSFRGSELLIRDDKGQIVMRLKMNEKGTFEFELLPFRYGSFIPLVLEDPSLLSITLQGKVTSTTGDPINSLESVMIVDDHGIPIAVTRVESNGDFVFPQVRPTNTYNFRLTDQSKADQIVLFDRSRSITLPLLQAEATYRRFEKDEAIELVDEHNKKISIAPEDVFVINRIYFDYRSNTLTAEARTQLEILASILKANPRAHIEVISHTDSRGSAEHNKVLSLKRAQSVSNYLNKLGLSSGKISVKGMGESDPIIICSENETCDESDHSLNRRTEIRIVNQ